MIKRNTGKLGSRDQESKSRPPTVIVASDRRKTQIGVAPFDSARNTKRNLNPNSDSRFSDRRLHLTSREVERLLGAAKGGRNEARDRCLLLLMFRHGLRVSEACRLKLDQVDADSRVIHVVRLKRGLSTTQPLRADAVRAIGAWLK